MNADEHEQIVKREADMLAASNLDWAEVVKRDPNDPLTFPATPPADDGSEPRFDGGSDVAAWDRQVAVCAQSHDGHPCGVCEEVSDNA